MTVLGKKLTGTSSLAVEYKGLVDPVYMAWWVLAVTSGLVKLKEDRLNMCHKNSGRTVRGNQHFVCGKGTEDLKIIHRPQGRVKAFQLSKG